MVSVEKEVLIQLIAKKLEMRNRCLSIDYIILLLERVGNIRRQEGRRRGGGEEQEDKTLDEEE